MIPKLEGRYGYFWGQLFWIRIFFKESKIIFYAVADPGFPRGHICQHYQLRVITEKLDWTFFSVLAENIMSDFFSVVCDALLSKPWKSLYSEPQKNTRGIYVIGKKMFNLSVADPRFSPGGRQPPSGCANLFFGRNCMKMKEFWPRGRPWRPPLDPSV